MDAAHEQVSTRNVAAYLTLGFSIAGLNRPPHVSAILYALWISCIFVFFVLYFPLSFLLSPIMSAETFTPAELLQFMPIAINGLGFAIRLLMLYFVQERLRKALTLLDRLDLHCTTPAELSSIRATTTLSNRIFLGYAVLYTAYVISNSTNVFFTARPGFNMYNPLWDWRTDSRHLYAQAAMEFGLVAFATFIEQLIDCYPLVYVICLRTHVKMLTTRVTQLHDTPAVSGLDAHYLALVRCVQDHKLMLDYCSTLRPVISFTIFVQFLVCGSILGLAMIKLLLFANLSTAISTVIYLVAVLLQTFPLCYYCNCLIDDCYSLSDAVFHSRWCMEDRRYRQTLRYFLQKVQQPMTFTASGVFPITISTNISFAKFAFTVYTVASQSKVLKQFIETD